MNDYRIVRTIVCQLPYGSDLLDEMTSIVRREKITLGRIQALGATIRARVAYYDQDTKVYNPLDFPGGMEILNVHGNVSLRDGGPFVHAHILLGDPRGNTVGGHLLQGTKLFACELIIDEYSGPALERAQDARTGLFLWTSGFPE